MARRLAAAASADTPTPRRAWPRDRGVYLVPTPEPWPRRWAIKRKKKKEDGIGLSGWAFMSCDDKKFDD